MEKIFIANRMDYYVSANVFTKLQTPLRQTDEYEIELYTTSGNTSVINDVVYKQKKGNILVAKPGDVRYSIGSFECYCVHFSCDDEEICEALASLPTVFAYSDTEVIEKKFKELIDAHSLRGIARTLRIQGILMELISLFVAENAGNYSGKYEHYIDNIADACDYIKQNFERHLTLDDIAARANLSPGFFHTVFKSIKNITPSEYLTGVRMENAKEMLKNSDVPLADIAVLCGFGSQGYFNYVFKKKSGATPKAYRDKKRIII